MVKPYIAIIFIFISHSALSLVSSEGYNIHVPVDLDINNTLLTEELLLDPVNALEQLKFSANGYICKYQSHTSQQNQQRSRKRKHKDSRIFWSWYEEKIIHNSDQIDIPGTTCTGNIIYQLFHSSGLDKWSIQETYVATSSSHEGDLNISFISKFPEKDPNVGIAKYENIPFSLAPKGKLKIKIKDKKLLGFNITYNFNNYFVNDQKNNTCRRIQHKFKETYNCISKDLLPSISNNKKSYCHNIKDPSYFKQIIKDPNNHLFLPKRNGFLFTGTCWWNSRIQRNSLYLAIYRPDLAKPNKQQVIKIFHDLRKMKKVITIPGFKNFKEFSSAFKKVFYKELYKWQLEEGILEKAWKIGISGKSYQNAEKLKNTMDTLYQQVIEKNR